MNLRYWIGRVLWSCGAALGIAIVSGLLSLVLRGLGDRAAADAVNGVTLVTLTVFVIGLIVMVVLLAVCELQRDQQAPGDDRPRR